MSAETQLTQNCVVCFKMPVMKTKKHLQLTHASFNDGAYVAITFILKNQKNASYSQIRTKFHPPPNTWRSLMSTRFNGTEDTA